MIVSIKQLAVVLALVLVCITAIQARAAISTTGDVAPADPNTWDSNTYAYIGESGNGTLEIGNGGSVSSLIGSIGHESGSLGEVTVDGVGSTWTNDSSVYARYYGSGTLNIINGGIVSVAGELTIDYNRNGGAFVNMSTGGMLALSGDADDSLIAFLGLIDGMAAIRYWDDSISDWDDITAATYGEDYWVEYLSDGSLAGYTLLTVGVVPDPTIPGDVNLSGLVNDDDLSLLLANWVIGDEWGEGDLNENGTVNDDDLSLLLANWGAGSSPAGEAVPEPASALILLLGLPYLARRRARR